MSPLHLFGVAAHDPNDAPALPAGVSLLPFRDLAAVTAEARQARPTLGPRELDAHRAAVAAVFARQAVLPAPTGVVFRTPDALVRWMELHYVTLSDGLAFVEGRVAARVHVGRRAAHAVGTVGGDTEELSVDVDNAAADVFRVLRRHAVAAVTVKPSPEAGAATSAAATSSFLVERDRWRFFEEVVAEEGRRDPDLLFRLTGPWPPYDFVRMEFGG